MEAKNTTPFALLRLPSIPCQSMIRIWRQLQRSLCSMARVLHRERYPVAKSRLKGSKLMHVKWSGMRLLNWREDLCSHSAPFTPTHSFFAYLKQIWLVTGSSDTSLLSTVSRCQSAAWLTNCTAHLHVFSPSFQLFLFVCLFSKCKLFLSCQTLFNFVSTSLASYSTFEFTQHYKFMKCSKLWIESIQEILWQTFCEACWEFAATTAPVCPRWSVPPAPATNQSLLTQPP